MNPQESTLTTLLGVLVAAVMLVLLTMFVMGRVQAAVDALPCKAANGQECTK